MVFSKEQSLLIAATKSTRIAKTVFCAKEVASQEQDAVPTALNSGCHLLLKDTNAITHCRALSAPRHCLLLSFAGNMRQ